jgi:hypothetical protein
MKRGMKDRASHSCSTWRRMPELSQVTPSRPGAQALGRHAGGHGQRLEGSLRVFRQVRAGQRPVEQVGGPQPAFRRQRVAGAGDDADFVRAQWRALEVGQLLDLAQLAQHHVDLAGAGALGQLLPGREHELELQAGVQGR